MLSAKRSESQKTNGFMDKPPVWVIMGVSGAGKSSIAQLLAEQKNYCFIEGDTLHPATNIDAMRSGKPLTDAMRAPWLSSIAAAVQQERGADVPGIIVSCSALKLAYRDFLRDHIPHLRFIYLNVSREILIQRLRSRQGHFMTDQLLDSQLSTLELFDHETDMLIVDADQPSDIIIATLLPQLILTSDSKCLINSSEN